MTSPFYTKVKGPLGYSSVNQISLHKIEAPHFAKRGARPVTEQRRGEGNSWMCYKHKARRGLGGKQNDKTREIIDNSIFCSIFGTSLPPPENAISPQA